MDFLDEETVMKFSDWLGRGCCVMGVALMMLGSFLVPVNAPLWADPGFPGVTLKCDSSCGVECGEWLTVRPENAPPFTTCWNIGLSGEGWCNTVGSDCDGCANRCESQSQVQTDPCVCIEK